MLGVALYCLLGACPIFVAGTGREMSSPYIDELTYNTNFPMRILRPRPYWASITSGSVPFCTSGFSRIPNKGVSLLCCGEPAG